MGERWHFHDLGKISGIPLFLDQNKNILEKIAKIAKVVLKKSAYGPPSERLPRDKKLVRAEGFWDCNIIYAYFLRKLWHFHDPVKFFDRFVRAG